MRNTFLSVLLGLAISCVWAGQAGAYPQREFVANISSSLPDWRPHRAINADEAQILTAVYEGLFVYDPYTMDPILALAQSWKVSEDRLTWTFTLREGASFSDGSPITSKEIVDSWFNLLDPSIVAPYASLLDCIAGAADYRSGKNNKRASVGISTPHKGSIVVTLTSPTEHLPKILCHHAFSAVHPSNLGQAAGKVQKTGFIPISSGPFVIQSVTKDEIRLTPNSHYWDKDQVSLPSIKILISDDAANLTYRFNLGEIHWLAGSSQIERILSPSSVQITPMFSTEYFFFRTTWGPWADSRVRNALLRAVPWAELRASYIIPASTLVYPISGYPKLDGITAYNSAEAKTMLAEAGITNPSSLPPIVIRIPKADPFEKLAKILETAWTDLGFVVQLESIPFILYNDRLKEDTYTIAITSWIGDFADPLSFLEMFRKGSTLNDSGWHNSEYENMILESSSDSNGQDRYELLSRAEKLLLDEGVILPVAHNPALNVIASDELEGWYANVLDIHPFKFIRFIPRKPLPGVVYSPSRVIPTAWAGL